MPLIGPVGDGLGVCPAAMVVCPATAGFKNGEREGNDGITSGEFSADDVGPWAPMPKTVWPGEDSTPRLERWSLEEFESWLKPKGRDPGDAAVR